MDAPDRVQLKIDGWKNFDTAFADYLANNPSEIQRFNGKIFSRTRCLKQFKEKTKAALDVKRVTTDDTNAAVRERFCFISLLLCYIFCLHICNWDRTTGWACVLKVQKTRRVTRVFLGKMLNWTLNWSASNWKLNMNENRLPRRKLPIATCSQCCPWMRSRILSWMSRVRSSWRTRDVLKGSRIPILMIGPQ